MPVPGELQRHRSPTPTVRDHVGDAWYQTTVRVPRGWAGQRDRAALRLGDAPRPSVWVDDTEVLGHEGGYTPFEADVTDARRARRARSGSPSVVNNELTLPDDPAGHRRGHPARAAGSATSTTSSTTPACTARCGCTRRRRPTSTTSRSSPTSTAATGVVALRGRTSPATARRTTVRVTLRDADGARGRHRRGRARRADGRRRAPVGARRRLPLRRSRSSCVDDGGRLLDSYHQSVGVRTVEVRGDAVPDQRRAVLLHRASASTRTPPCAARATTTRSWCTTSSCSTGSAPTRSAPRTTRTPRRSTTTPTGTGIVVIDETAAVGLNMGLGGGIFGGQGYTTFSPETINDAARRCTRRRSAS